MSIASEITRLQGVKSDILQAISDKGVTVPAGSALDDCPDLIASISSGGGGGDFIKGTTIINGVEYPTVKINGLTWLAKNFNLLLDGVPINPGTLNTPAQYYPRNEYRNIYGMLYNGAAVEYIEANKATICPGWHVPTKNEFDNLINYFNGLNYLQKIICSQSYNHGAGDVIGFNLLPGGNWDKYFETFSYEGQNAYLYCIDKSGSDFWHIDTSPGLVQFYTSYGDSEYALNLRLVRDV